MNKKIITALVALVLVAPLVVSAVALCPEGYHWEQTEPNTTQQGECNEWSETECQEWSSPECVGYEQIWNEGYYTQGECNSWGEAPCLSYEQECQWQCTKYHPVWGYCIKFGNVCQSVCSSWGEAPCNGYEQIWNEGYYTQGQCNEWTEAVCLSNTEAVCLGYEQVVITGGGVCDRDHEGSTNYQGQSSQGNGGAVNLYNLLARVVYGNAKVWTGQWLNWVEVSWLTTQMSTSRVVWGEVSQDWPVSQFGYPYFGGSVLVNGTNPMNGTNYGYQYSTQEITDLATYHEVFIPSWKLKPNTTYFYRTISHEADRQEFVSQEMTFTTY